MKKYNLKQMKEDVEYINWILKYLDTVTEWNDELDTLYYNLSVVRDALVKLTKKGVK